MSAIAPIRQATTPNHGKSARTAQTSSGAAGFFAALEQALAQGDSATATATSSATQPVQAAGDAAPAQTSETKTDDADMLNAAALASAQALAATATPATTKLADAGAALTARLSRHHHAQAQSAGAETAKPQTAAAATQPAAAAKIWNTADLTQHLKAALGEKLTGEAQEQSSIPGAAHPNLAASFATLQEGDKIRQSGTQNLMRAMQAGKTQAQSAAQTLTQQAVPPAAPAHNAALKSALQQFTAAAPAPQPGKATDEALVAALSTAAKSAAEREAEPLSAPATTQPLEWTPEPVATTGDTETTGASRLPSLAEQVRQATDFIADRTTGVIRMGDKGVEANLRLYPPDLGGVRVQMTVTASGATQANFIVERPETAQLLQQHLRSFQQGMESRGLAVERVQVTLQSTVGAASSTSTDSGWRQETAQDFRRESSLSGQRDHPNSKRNRGKEQPAFEG